MKKKYQLDVKRDVDPNEDGFFLYLTPGWRFDDDVVHCRNFDTMPDLRRAVKKDVIECDCTECQELLKKRA